MILWAFSPKRWQWGHCRSLQQDNGWTRDLERECPRSHKVSWNQKNIDLAITIQILIDVFVLICYSLLN